MWIPLLASIACWVTPSAQSDRFAETFVDNTRIEYGVRVEPDGTRLRHGDYLLFDADDVQRVAGSYKDGERSGRWTYSRTDGRTWILGKYSKGLRHGSWSIKNADQSIAAKGKYKWGATSGKSTLVDDAGVERVGEFEQETTEYADGSLAGEGTVFDGRKHGRWTFYWRSGRKQLEADYFDGNRTGSWLLWHSDGSVDKEMLRERYGTRQAVTPEFYVDPIPERREPHSVKGAPEAIDPGELAPIVLSEAMESSSDPHDRLRVRLAKTLEALRTRDYDQPNAWQEAQKFMDETLEEILCGHRILATDSGPGPWTTGRAIARLHTLYWITESSPDFWFIDMNHTNHEEETEFCSLILHPGFRGDGLQSEHNRTGPYSLRFRRADRDLARRGGGGTEQSLASALEWLVENQEADGAWLADDSFYAAGVTGLALLALMADGNTLRHGPYQESVRRGVSFLIERPHPALKWKPNPKRSAVPKSLIPEEVSWVRNTTFLYTQAIITQVFCELAAMSDGPLIRQVARSNADLSIKYKNPYAVWGYVMPGTDINDTPLTCWMIAALIAAERAGIEVDQEYRANSITWLDEVTELMFGRAGYRARDQNSSREVGVNDHYPRDLTEALTAAGLWARYALDQDPEVMDVMERSADTLIRRLPVWDAKDGYSNDCYYWYHASNALAFAGGEHQKAWSKALKNALLPNQDLSQENRGSWDNNGPWGSLGGRAYSTALLALCLESYYRYDRPIR